MFLTHKLKPTMIRKMEAETATKPGETADQDSQETTQQVPLSKLRDLRPEKDPMGAGRPGLFGKRP